MDRVVSVVPVPHSKWSYWAPALYEPRARQRDGVVTFRRVDRLYRCRSRAKAERLAREWADQLGCEFDSGVRHGMEVRDV